MKNNFLSHDPKNSASPKNVTKRADAKHVMLVGNPNCGKSTLFNRLCNVHVRTGNYPGVTVGRHVGNYNSKIQVIDIPGIYSLTTNTAEEKIASAELLNNDAELIVNIIDSTNLERSLYLTLELRTLGIPMITLLNFWDTLPKEGITIDVEKLSKELGIKIIPFSATTNVGMNELELILNSDKWERVAPKFIGNENIAQYIDELRELTPDNEKPKACFFAKSALQGDVIPDELIEDKDYQKKLSEIKENLTQNNESIHQVIAKDRYNTISEILKKVYSKVEMTKESFTEKVDKILLNKYLALPIFIVIMFIVYYISVTSLGAMVTDWTNDELFGNIIIPYVSALLTNLDTPEFINSFISEGVIGGVGAVLGFVPQLIILFVLLSILEECGYMTRATLILDRIFRIFGLSGKAFIPFLIGTGCTVPAYLNIRTLQSESERKLTLFTAGMVPCGAKLPVIVIFANFVFKDTIPNFAPCMYILSMVLIVISALILQKFQTFKSSDVQLLLQLPNYQIPNKRVIFFTVLHRIKSFVYKAGTVIFASVFVIWMLSSFGYNQKDGFSHVESPETSFLADISKPISPIFSPLGFNDYRATVATVSGMIAKENIISTMGTLIGVGDVDENDQESENAFAIAITNDVFKGDLVAALSFVIFNLFTLPCLAALGVLRRELGSNKLFSIAVLYQLFFSYSVTFICYQIGTLIITGNLTILTYISFALVALFIFLLLRPSKAKDIQISFKMES